MRQETIALVIELLERSQELAKIRALERHGGVLVIEGRAGVGKTALLDAACAVARRKGRLVLRARGSELERNFAFGLIRQLFERHVANMNRREKAVLFGGAANAARELITGDRRAGLDLDTPFAVMHGLYWLTVNLAHKRSLMIAVDDAQWADDTSLRWLAYLAGRLAGLDASLGVTLHPEDPQSQGPALLSLRALATTMLRPALLSAGAVAAIARARLGAEVDKNVCAQIHEVTGGNPFYVLELLRAMKSRARSGAPLAVDDHGGLVSIAAQLGARVRKLDEGALRLARTIAILGEGCELRHAAMILRISMDKVASLATQLVRLDILGNARPPRFVHPIVRHAIVQTLSNAQYEAAHLQAAWTLYAARGEPERIAAHAMKVGASGDPWIVDRFRDGARAALEHGAPASAAAFLERALEEPPPEDARVEILREAARAHLRSGRSIACQRLEEALELVDNPDRARLSSELAQAYATLFRWADAVGVLERALDSLGHTDPTVATTLLSQLATIGLQDAGVARRAVQAMEHLSHCPLRAAPAAALSVARGMFAIMTGQPVDEAAQPLERALADIDVLGDNWDLHAALWWCLATAERFDVVGAALEKMRERVDRSGSSRGLVAVYSTVGLLKLRLGALPEADAAARVALRVAQEGDFAPGLPFAATVLADVAIASGDLDEARALLASLPTGDLPAGVGTALIPAARGRLLLAQLRAREALAEFEKCMYLWKPDIWGIEVRDAGFLHARSGAALSLLSLGHIHRARELAEAELSDVRRFGGRRALGVALRTAGLARDGDAGLSLLEESVAALRGSPAMLERARSLIEWGGRLRRAGLRRDARRVLSEGLDAAARCGARPLISYAREELNVAGARPRRDWTSGVESLTPGELRIVQLARKGQSNRQIAQALYLSIKTVEGHLARAYDKLGIKGRAALGQVLAPEKTRVPTL